MDIAPNGKEIAFSAEAKVLLPSVWWFAHQNAWPITAKQETFVVKFMPDGAFSGLLPVTRQVNGEYFSREKNPPEKEKPYFLCRLL